MHRGGVGTRCLPLALMGRAQHVNDCNVLQVNGYDDPDLGLGIPGSTQTEFHCPPMTLRYGTIW